MSASVGVGPYLLDVEGVLSDQERFARFVNKLDLRGEFFPTALIERASCNFFTETGYAFVGFDFEKQEILATDVRSFVLYDCGFYACDLQLATLDL